MVRVEEDSFGTALNPSTNKAEPIRRFTISNKNMSVQVITYGGIITAINVPDADGKMADIALGYDNVPGYLTASNPYIGAVIGRVCSRVGNGKFELNGREISVSKNFLGKHQLHGGFIGFDKVIWDVYRVRPDGVVFTFCSPDGHEGYPGQVVARVTYTLTDDDCFRFCMEATTTKPTPVNMTNHAYFNLAGHDSGSEGMYEHMVMIKADQYTDMDEDTVPNGRILDLTGTILDLRKMTNVGEGLKPFYPKGYDHNYVLDYCPNAIKRQAQAYHPPSGRFMEISSNQPCMHFYTSHNMPDVKNGAKATIKGKGGVNYTKHSAFCMETHWYPNAMNLPNFPSVILNPGEKYMHICTFKFGIVPRDVKNSPSSIA